jgi:hypothetical protein
MIRADLVTSLVLMALGLATAEESWRMPRYADVGAEPWAAPGVVPGMLGAALVILALILCLRSVAARRSTGEGADAAAPGGWGRVATVVGICLAYAGVLVGRAPFWLATFLFVFAFVAVFELNEPAGRTRWRRHVIGALVLAGLTAAVVPWIFQTIFLVRLP